MNRTVERYTAGMTAPQLRELADDLDRAAAQRGFLVQFATAWEVRNLRLRALKLDQDQ